MVGDRTSAPPPGEVVRYSVVPRRHLASGISLWLEPRFVANYSTVMSVPYTYYCTITAAVVRRRPPLLLLCEKTHHLEIQQKQLLANGSTRLG